MGRLFDTVTLCLSKGLGCPLGALLAGSTETIERAWREKHLFGGAMRQAGIVAAAGVYALEHHIDRLAEDHARAHRLAEGWHAAGLPVDLDQVETNFVQLDVGALGLGRDEALARLREAGVGLSSTIHPTVIRAVTHLDLDDDADRPGDRAGTAGARGTCRCLTGSLTGSSGWSPPLSPSSAFPPSAQRCSATETCCGARRSDPRTPSVGRTRPPSTPTGSVRSPRRSPRSASSSSATRWCSTSTIRSERTSPRRLRARRSQTRCRT